ncbi:TIGR01906 family membrane protein [Alkaliphilus hydrothermalis]|uniref:Integral membrane protein (TIGR01906 family) n=1 Tax=Alkaliphilus hydrothermalis TaxID=1482730 RepID=A0ABS2NKT9_9FIRM|nr:TIGR01906 family membrane protein [Alkaliphilus hydrothermalis]MBM7613559.1 integral membrane protein (TIGR01906 family) [Alkaliphilus hydrothermalis]
MKKHKLAYILLGIFISIIFLFKAVEIVAFNEAHYEAMFIKYDIPKATGLELEELRVVMGDVLKYLKDDRELLDTTMIVDGNEEAAFGERAVLHMIDVKELFIAGGRIRNIGFVVVIGLLIYLRMRDGKWKENFTKAMFYVGIVNILLMLLLYILMLMDFYKYFTYFHLIFFDNDLWMLEADELMIQMLPEGFFNDTAVKIASYFFGVNVLLGVIGFRKFGVFDRLNGKGNKY